MEDLFFIAADPDTGLYTCSCGGFTPPTTTKKGKERWLAYHPVECSKKRRRMKELAQGVRSVVDEEWREMDRGSGSVRDKSKKRAGMTGGE